MPDQPSAVYHLDWAGRIPPGKLIHIEDRPDGTSDIFLHPFHARAPLTWQFNWLTRHQVGYGLWQQRWTHEGRMQEPVEGKDIAESRWEIVPARAMPWGKVVVPVESDKSCIWLIKSGHCTVHLRDAMNLMLERIAGDGLWRQPWDEEQRIPERPVTPAPLVAPPAQYLWL